MRIKGKKSYKPSDYDLIENSCSELIGIFFFLTFMSLLLYMSIELLAGQKRIKTRLLDVDNELSIYFYILLIKWLCIIH